MAESSASANNRGSTQHLWNLLKGGIVLVTDDTILEELRDNVERLTQALTYYKTYEEVEGEEKVTFPTAPSFARSVFEVSKEDSESSAQADSTASKPNTTESNQDASKKSEPKMNPFVMITKAVAQNLNLDLTVAKDLVVSYMMFECKCTYASYEEIADTQASFFKFLKDLKEFFKRERACLLLCIQTLLAGLGDEEHKLHSVINNFREQIPPKNWCWGLLMSIVVAQDDMEIVEILHSLALLMYQLPNETVPAFFNYFTKRGFDHIRKSSEKVRIAEGVAMYPALVVSGITDCCSGVFPQEYGSIIRDFINSNFENLLMNPFNFGPLFASYDIFCKEDSEVTAKMKQVKANLSRTFSCMLKLTEHYGKNSANDRNMLSLMVSSSVFEAFEVILANYDVSHFGTNQQAFEILAKILEHNPVAENFLCGTPLALTALYTDATITFPLDIPSTLQIWRSLCMSVSNAELCNTIVKGVAKLNSVAEQIDDDQSFYFRRIDNYKVVNLKGRELYGIFLEEGNRGTISNVGRNQCVVWELPPTLNMSAFDVLRWGIQPISDILMQMKAHNAPDIEYQRYDYASQDLHAISQFVIQFWKHTDEQVSELTMLIYPACMIMETMLKYRTNMQERIHLIQDLFGVVTSVNEFCAEMALINFIYDIMPGSDNVTLVEEMILGHESVSLTKCEVALSLLDLICSFTENEKCWKQGRSSIFEGKFLRCLRFIAENIVPICPRWRTVNEGIRIEVYLRCLKIFIRIFSLQGSEWRELKQECLKFLVLPSSLLIILLQTEESKLMNSIIRPTEDDKLLPTVLCLALRLLLRIIRFDKRTIKEVDKNLNGLLVRILGRFVRHRHISIIPSVSIMVLTEIARNSTQSLLACFGNDEAAFRNVIIQRLDFAVEDVNLKISIIEFLAIIAQTQVGIIECFFDEGALEDTILRLIRENEALSVACLHFFRSTFRQGLPCPRHRDEFWDCILAPLKDLKRDSLLEIVTASFHIMTFEMFLGGSDKLLSKKLGKILLKEKMVSIMETVFSQEGLPVVKCLQAIKHFFTLMLGRSELARLVPSNTLGGMQMLIVDMFKEAKPTDDELLCLTITELLIILTTPEGSTNTLLSELLSNLVENFRDHKLCTQLSLVCLMNKLFVQCPNQLSSADMENTFIIAKRVFEASSKMLETDDAQNILQLLTVTARLVATVIEKQPIDVWGLPMQKLLIPAILIGVTSTAIRELTAPDVVANCLSALIALAEHPNGCSLVPISGISNALYLPLARYNEETDEPWNNVFFLCLSLNTKLLGNLKQVYLDEALTFWGQFSEFFNQKLSVVAELTEICVAMEDAEKGYNDMKAAFLRTTFILNDILVLTPYIELWQAAQACEVHRAIKNVFYILQEVCSLLQQPYLLQSSMGQRQRTPSSTATTEVKSFPKLGEMQLKLWETCDICMQILVRLRSKDDEFIEQSVLIPTVFQVGQLGIKAINKAEKKVQVSLTNRASSVLEKVLVIILRFTSPVLDDPAVDYKYQVVFRREWSTEMVSLCDGIRRLNMPKHDFLISLCTKLENKFK